MRSDVNGFRVEPDCVADLQLLMGLSFLSLMNFRYFSETAQYYAVGASNTTDGCPQAMERGLHASTASETQNILSPGSNIYTMSSM